MNYSLTNVLALAVWLGLEHEARLTRCLFDSLSAGRGKKKKKLNFHSTEQAEPGIDN
jgi:hypothetical protein